MKYQEKKLQNNLYMQVPKVNVHWFLKPSIEEITYDERYYFVKVSKVYPPLKRVKGKLVDEEKGVRLA